MAGGPLFPTGEYPVTADRVFPYTYVSAGANWKHNAGLLAFQASLGADSIWRLGWILPQVLPSGTFKLRLRCQANATSGAAKINPKSAVVAAGNDPAGATLTAEGTQTLTWAAGDNDKYKDLDVALTPTPVAGSSYIMDLTGETSGWTLAQILAFTPMLIWT